MRALSVFVPLMLCGCMAVVSVRSDGVPPKLSFWPMGVKIERADSDAVAVDSLTVGASVDDWSYGLGVSKVSRIMVNPKVCGVAIVYTDKPGDFLAKISDDTRAACLHGKGSEQ